MSEFEKILELLPEDIESKEDVILWLLDNGIYIHSQDKALPLNDLCNHMDLIILKEGENISGAPASQEWFSQAARNKIFYCLAEARAIQTGACFEVKLEQSK